MTKIDANTPANVGNIEITKSKNIFSKNHRYTITIEGIKHHYVDKPLNKHSEIKANAETINGEFKPITLSNNKINDTALIFNKMCEAEKTYKPVEFITKMIENGKFSSAFAILNNENLSKCNSNSIICRLGNDRAAKMLDNISISEAITFLNFLENSDYILDQMTFEQLGRSRDSALIYEIANVFEHEDDQKQYTDSIAGKIVEKMCNSDIFKTANIISLVSDSRAATILSNMTANQAAKIITEMATYKPTRTPTDNEIYLSIDKAAAILSDKKLSDEVAADIFSKLPHDIQEKIYDKVTDPIKQLNLLKKCKPHTK